MTHPEDTVLTVTRSIFFTDTLPSFIYPRPTLPQDSLTERVYKGYLTSDPSNVFTFKITKIFQNYYDGYSIQGLAYFYVGLPFADSIMVPRDVSTLGCSNYKHQILITNRFNNPKFSELTHHLSRIDYVNQTKKKRIIKLSFFNNYHPNCTFIGEEI